MVLVYLPIYIYPQNYPNVGTHNQSNPWVFLPTHPTHWGFYQPIQPLGGFTNPSNPLGVLPTHPTLGGFYQPIQPIGGVYQPMTPFSNRQVAQHGFTFT